MKVKSVWFRSSIQLREFQHVHIEVCADVPEGTSAAARRVLDELKAFVARELRRAKDGDQPVPLPGKFRV